MSQHYDDIENADEEHTCLSPDSNMDITSLHFSIDASNNKENDDPLEDTDEDERTSLFKLANNRKHNPIVVIGEWITHYMNSPNDALIDVLEFILEASGCNYRIPKNHELPFNWSAILIEATANFGNRSVHYPLIMKTNSMFVENVSQFVHQLMRSVISSSIYLDDYFLKNITDFVAVVSDSKVRAFRHTTTLLALKMMTALSSTASLHNPKLRKIWQQLFANVYLVRSNDTLEEIRLLTVAECSVWLEKYPECYMQPSDIKYLFEFLQDNAPKLCESSFHELFKLYNKTELRAAFLEQGLKYRVTLVGLTMSSENELSQKAIELMGNLYKLSPQIANESMWYACDTLVFAAHRGVAQAAAELVPFRFSANDKSEQERLMMLINFFIRVQGPEGHCAYLVDAYYGRNNIVLAWSTMVDMLMQPPEALKCKESSVLIEIMCRAITQAVSGAVPQGRYTEDMVRQPLANAKKHATRIVLPRLPALMRRYCRNATDLCNLLELPQYMTLTQAHVQQLLDEIQCILFEQEHMMVLEMGAQTMEHLYSLSDENNNHRKQLLNSAVTSFMIASTVSEQPSDESSSKRLLVALSLVSVLYACFDMHEYKLCNHVLPILKQDSEPPSAEQVSLYLKIVWFSLCWDLKRLRQIPDDVNVSNECQALRTRFEEFIVVTSSLISQNTNVNVSCDAFVLVCDIFILFNDELRQSSNADVARLEYQTTVHDYAMLEKFMVRYVFNNAEEEGRINFQDPAQFALFSSKRLILASYLKLSFHNLMPMMRTCIVLQHYRTFNASFGDLMRSLMERSMSNNPTNFGMTLLHTGLLIFERIKANYPNPDDAALSSEFADLLRLAEMLAERCWLDSNLLDARVSMVALHKASIRFATVDPKANVLFFRYTEMFLPQLIAQDLIHVIKFLSVYRPGMLALLEKPEKSPLESYRTELEIAIAKSCRRRDWDPKQKQ